MRLRALAAAAATLALASCSSAPVCPPELTKVEIQPPTPIPASMLVCPPAPLPPADGSMQSAGADWATKMVIAYESCREQLSAVSAYQAMQESQAAAPAQPAAK